MATYDKYLINESPHVRHSGIYKWNPDFKVIINSHYEIKHAVSINDQIIIRLVYLLNGRFFEVDDIDGRFQYFVVDGLILEGKKYKLVWLLEDNQIYIGVVNAYRR